MLFFIILLFLFRWLLEIFLSKKNNLYWATSLLPLTSSSPALEHPPVPWPPEQVGGYLSHGEKRSCNLRPCSLERRLCFPLSSYRQGREAQRGQVILWDAQAAYGKPGPLTQIPPIPKPWPFQLVASRRCWDWHTVWSVWSVWLEGTSIHLGDTGLWVLPRNEA